MGPIVIVVERTKRLRKEYWCFVKEVVDSKLEDSLLQVIVFYKICAASGNNQIRVTIDVETATALVIKYEVRESITSATQLGDPAKAYVVQRAFGQGL